MGREIQGSGFTDADFAEFGERLGRETALLERWFAEGRFADEPPTAGFELEAWFVDRALEPAPIIEPFLAALRDPMVVPELAAFNLELNGAPQPLRGDALSRLHDGLTTTLEHCRTAAAPLGARVAMIGTLPTVEPHHFSLDAMSPLHRYRALNEQVLRMRAGRPLRLDIEGRDRLHIEHNDVMLESAATSFQIHLKVSAGEAGRVFNASKILSAPMVALAANSPFLFGAELWDESRVPIFEQAVDIGGSDLARRVGFGIRYVRHSVLECFQANYHRYPVLLPKLFEGEPEESLAHLLLHNGTIWRWNRPLIGFDAEGGPHLRIEHRVIPAGPTIADSIANAAFYYGTVHSLASDPRPPEQIIPFERARTNFYRAARDGLRAEIGWLDGRDHPVRSLILERLLPEAERGLRALEIDPLEIERWLGIVRARVASGINGAAWQRAWVARHGRDMRGLLQQYLENQTTGRPVHEWAP